jgi:hypothetical protein
LIEFVFGGLLTWLSGGEGNEPTGLGVTIVLLAVSIRAAGLKTGFGGVSIDVRVLAGGEGRPILWINDDERVVGLDSDEYVRW